MTKKVKFLFYIPLFIVEYLLGKVSGYVSCLNYKHLIMSAKIDDDTSISEYKLGKFRCERSTAYISNRNLRRTIDFLNLFSNREWQVFSIYDKESEGREVIYLTKERITFDDIICGSRISDCELSQDYKSNKLKRTLFKKGAKDIRELEPQIYVVASRVKNDHTIMKNERSIRYAKNRIREFNKRVDLAIKRGGFLSRWSMGDFSPVLHKCVLEDRVDLINKILNNALDDDERIKLVNTPIDESGCVGMKIGDKAIDLCKSDEMREILSKYIIKKPTN